jgi:hypothetical protein
MLWLDLVGPLVLSAIRISNKLVQRRMHLSNDGSHSLQSSHLAPHNTLKIGPSAKLTWRWNASWNFASATNQSPLCTLKSGCHHLKRKHQQCGCEPCHAGIDGCGRPSALAQGVAISQPCSELLTILRKYFANVLIDLNLPTRRTCTL